MWVFAVLIGLLVGGLLFPMHPRLTGVVFALIGASTYVVWALGWISGSPLGILAVAAMWVALGIGKIWQFRDPTVRASHRRQWTGAA